MSRSLWSRQWPLTLVLAGLGLLGPLPALRSISDRIELLLLTVTRLEDPLSILLGEKIAVSATTLGLDQGIRLALDEARRAVQPPADWQTAGSFHPAAVGEPRRHDRLPLLLAGAVPDGAPAFVGDVLIGITGHSSSGEPVVIPLTASDSRLEARCAGRSEGEEEQRFVVVGLGQPSLEAVATEHPGGLRPGSRAWTPVSLGGEGGSTVAAHIGVIEGEEGDELARPRRRVRPPWRLADLHLVSILYPPGLEPPQPWSLQAIPVRVSRRFLHDPGRRGFVLDHGLESGISRGPGVSQAGVLLGRIERSGFGRMLVRAVEDPGFDCGVFLLEPDGVTPWRLVVAGARQGRIRLRGGPPVAGCEGVALVTGPTSRWIPPGLTVGQLERDELGWWLRREVPPYETVLVHVPHPPDAGTGP